MHTAIRITIAAAAALMPLSPALAMDHPPQETPGGPTAGNPANGHGASGSPHSVPEPDMFALFATGIAGAYAGRRLAKRRKKD